MSTLDRERAVQQSSEQLSHALLSEDTLSGQDGLQLDSLGAFLRRVAPDTEPLMMFCLDANRFLRHCARADDAAHAGVHDPSSKTDDDLRRMYNRIAETYLRAGAPATVHPLLQAPAPGEQPGPPHSSLDVAGSSNHWCWPDPGAPANAELRAERLAELRTLRNQAQCELLWRHLQHFVGSEEWQRLEVKTQDLESARPDLDATTRAISGMLDQVEEGGGHGSSEEGDEDSYEDEILPIGGGAQHAERVVVESASGGRPAAAESSPSASSGGPAAVTESQASAVGTGGDRPWYAFMVPDSGDDGSARRDAIDAEPEILEWGAGSNAGPGVQCTVKAFGRPPQSARELAALGTKCGWLSKRGHGLDIPRQLGSPQGVGSVALRRVSEGLGQGLGLGRAYHRRWFVLCPTTYLYWFDSPDDVSPKGVIDLAHYDVCEADFGEDEGDIGSGGGRSVPTNMSGGTNQASAGASGDRSRAITLGGSAAGADSHDSESGAVQFRLRSNSRGGRPWPAGTCPRTFHFETADMEDEADGKPGDATTSHAGTAQSWMHALSSERASALLHARDTLSSLQRELGAELQATVKASALRDAEVLEQQRVQRRGAARIRGQLLGLVALITRTTGDGADPAAPGVAAAIDAASADADDDDDDDRGWQHVFTELSAVADSVRGQRQSLRDAQAGLGQAETKLEAALKDTAEAHAGKEVLQRRATQLASAKKLLVPELKTARKERETAKARCAVAETARDEAKAEAAAQTVRAKNAEERATTAEERAATQARLAAAAEKRAEAAQNESMSDQKRAEDAEASTAQAEAGFVACKEKAEAEIAAYRGKERQARMRAEKGEKSVASLQAKLSSKEVKEQQARSRAEKAEKLAASLQSQVGKLTALLGQQARDAKEQQARQQIQQQRIQQQQVQQKQQIQQQQQRIQKQLQATAAMASAPMAQLQSQPRQAEPPLLGKPARTWQNALTVASLKGRSLLHSRLIVPFSRPLPNSSAIASAVRGAYRATAVCAGTAALIADHEEVEVLFESGPLYMDLLPLHVVSGPAASGKGASIHAFRNPEIKDSKVYADQRGPAEAAGLRLGARMVMLNGTPVTESTPFGDVVRRAKTEPRPLLIRFSQLRSQNVACVATNATPIRRGSGLLAAARSLSKSGSSKFENGSGVASAVGDAVALRMRRALVSARSSFAEDTPAPVAALSPTKLAPASATVAGSRTIADAALATEAKAAAGRKAVADAKAKATADAKLIADTKAAADAKAADEALKTAERKDAVQAEEAANAKAAEAKRLEHAAAEKVAAAAKPAEREATVCDAAKAANEQRPGEAQLHREDAVDTTDAEASIANPADDGGATDIESLFGAKPPAGPSKVLSAADALFNASDDEEVPGSGATNESSLFGDDEEASAALFGSAEEQKADDNAAAATARVEAEIVEAERQAAQAAEQAAAQAKAAADAKAAEEQARAAAEEEERKRKEQEQEEAAAAAAREETERVEAERQAAQAAEQAAAQAKATADAKATEEQARAAAEYEQKRMFEQQLTTEAAKAEAATDVQVVVGAQVEAKAEAEQEAASAKTDATHAGEAEAGVEGVDSKVAADTDAAADDEGTALGAPPASQSASADSSPFKGFSSFAKARLSSIKEKVKDKAAAAVQAAQDARQASSGE